MMAPGSSVSTRYHVLGSSQAVEFPHHWLPFVRLGEPQVSMDVRLSDRQVLRYRYLSVDEEQQLFPRVLWEHHLLLAVVGGLLSLAVWMFSNDVVTDARTVQAWSLPTVTQPDGLAVGRMVDLSVRARCTLGSTVELVVDCQRLNLQETTTAVSLQAPKAGLVEWASGSRVDQMPAKGLLGGAGWSAQGLHMLAAGPVLITQALTLARDLDTLCEGAIDSFGQRVCGQLKMDLVASLRMEPLASPAQSDWSTALTLMERREASNEPIYAVMQLGELSVWKAHAQKVADAQLRAHVLAQLEALNVVQRGGVSLQLLHTSPIITEGQLNPDGLHAWRTLQSWAATPLLHQVKLAGVITQAEQADGRTTWVLDTQLTPDRSWRAFTRCGLLLMGLALLGWHLAALVIGFRRDVLRLRAIVDHWTRLESASLPGESESAWGTRRHA